MFHMQRKIQTVPFTGNPGQKKEGASETNPSLVPPADLLPKNGHDKPCRTTPYTPVFLPVHRIWIGAPFDVLLLLFPSKGAS
ncbi:hypothetical protein PITC_069330 [Penicillium italicum]|uniref:Uncharacterized protein n=1 Tax=Penicillium italicum TaxID=40296 RepID=A0A0A2LQD8_PENIT|nr:hypothetical protein PITC_069330 [Penicillium italicum]